MDKIEKTTEMLEQVSKAGKIGTIVGAVALGFASVGVAATGKKVVNLGKRAIDKLFPVKEEEPKAEESKDEAKKETK